MILDLLSGRRREPAECVIRVGSAAKEIGDLYPFLTEVSVDSSRSKPALATLEFESRRDEHGRWLIEDDGRLIPWEPIVIEAVFGSASEEIMRGYIREIRAEYPEDAASAGVTVECRDSSFVLDREHVRKAWGTDVPVSDQLVVAEILAKYGLTPDSANGSGQSGLVLNQDGTDIEFLRKRAEANGYELIFCENMVYFGPMRLDSEPQPTMMIYAGPDTHCIRFSAREDGHQADLVAYDRAEQEGTGTVSENLSPDLILLGREAASSSGKGLPDFSWRLSHQGGMSEEEWKARAQRKINELSLKVHAKGELDGSLYGHVLRVGEPVGVDGIGERYCGTYLVDTVRHRFNAEGYRQSFELLRNGYGDNLGARVGSRLAGVLGA
jgi:hypothetical protein